MEPKEGRSLLTTGRALFLFALLAVVLAAPGCEGRGQIEAVRKRIGVTVEGRSLPALESYYGVSAADKDHAWVVGTYGTVLSLTDNATKVTPQRSGTHQSLLSVTAADGKDCVIGGERGLVLRTTDGGSHWVKAKVPSSITDDIDAFSRGRDPTQIWGVGPEGTIVHSSDGGDTWEDLSLHKDVTLNGVSFLDDRNGWVAGEFGTILHTTDGGHTWNEAEKVTGLPKYVEDVTPDEAFHRGIPELEERDLYLFQSAWESPMTGYIVGTGGFVLTTNDGGQTWQATRGETRNTLFSIALPAAHPPVIVGILGTLLHKDGPNWSRDLGISNSVYTWLRTASFTPDGSLGVITGGKGTILLSHDGGSTWSVLDTKLLQRAG